MDFDDLTTEQIEKAKACRTTEELVALAKEEGVDLSDEQLKAMTGGAPMTGCGDDSFWDDTVGCAGQTCWDYACTQQ